MLARELGRQLVDPCDGGGGFGWCGGGSHVNHAMFFKSFRGLLVLVACGKPAQFSSHFNFSNIFQTMLAQYTASSWLTRKTTTTFRPKVYLQYGHYIS
jgi:hypothetical protein